MSAIISCWKKKKKTSEITKLRDFAGLFLNPVKMVESAYEREEKNIFQCEGSAVPRIFFSHCAVFLNNVKTLDLVVI